MSPSGVRVFYDADADPARLRDRVIAVIGYGSQGHAHSLNLRDSGVRVIVGLRPGGASWERARAEQLDVRPVADAAAAADVVMMLVPDQEARAVYEAGVAAALGRGKTLLFAHGFNIHFGEIVPPPTVDVAMIAPKSPGHMVRSEYQAGRGVPALVAVQRDASGHALDDALAYAAGIGCTRAGVLETSFREETETDLFGEQAVLCGGVAREWMAESRGGAVRFQGLRRAEAEHPIERIGARLRAMMPWTEEGARGSGLGARKGQATPEPRAPRPEPPKPEPLRA